MAFNPAQLMFISRVQDPSRGRVENLFAGGAAQRELVKENKLIAEVAQGWVGRYMKQNLKRPKVSTTRLLVTTMNEKNRYASAFLYGVGVPSYLDKSNTKYWRTIEEGSAATWKKRSFLELDLRGTFGATLEGYYKGGPPFSTPAGNPPPPGEGKFVPSGPFWRHPTERTKTGKPKTYGIMPVFHPRHEIAPMGAYAFVWSRGWMQKEGVQAVRKWFRNVLREAFRPPGWEWE